MDRFFSKLDLRDIKIDPEAKFPPDEDAYADSIEPDVASQSEYSNGADGQVAVAVETPVQVQRNGEVLKVSARSRPSAVAGAIAGVVREAGRAEVQAIGAGATNQAVKAVAIARDYLLETGIEAVCLPAFIDVTIDDEDRTAIRLIVEPR
jgi:stage V sporulation protein S